MKILSIFLATIFGFTAVSSAQTQADGIEALQTGQFAKAALIFEKITTEQPNDANLQMLLSDALLGLGKMPEAKTVLQKLSPDSPLGQVAIGRIFLMEKRLPEAKNAFAKAIKDNKAKNGSVLRHVGESFTIFKMEPETGVVHLEKAKTASPKDFEIVMALGDAYAANKKFGDAINQFEFAATLMPKSPAPHFRAGKILLTASSDDAFVEKMNLALTADPTFAPALRELGDHFYRKSDYAKAKDFYTKYLAAEPAPAVEDRMQFANILFLTKDYQQVIPLVEDILKTDASRNYLLRLVGYSYFETGENEKALAFMQDFLKKADPTKILASDYEYLGNALSKAGQDSLAVENFEKALAMDATNTALFGKVAEAKFKQKKYSEAAGFYGKLIEASEPTAQDYFNLGKSWFFAQDYVQADSAFANIVRIKPTAATGWLWRAKSNARLEPDVTTADTSAISLYGRAKPFFEGYISIASADPTKHKKDLVDAYNYLASYYYLKGQYDEAKLYCEKTLAIDPNDTYAQEMKKSF